MELNKIIRKIVNEKISKIHTCLPAKIESYNPQKMRAKVTLLAKKELEGQMVNIPPIVEVPVALLKAGPFVIRQPFQKGDPVLVVFGEKAIDKLLITGNPEDPQLKRHHSYDDAMVIGGLQLEQDPDLNSDYTEDLLIENKDTNSRIVIQKGGEIIIEDPSKIYIGSPEANEGAALGTSLKSWLDGHVHPISWTDPAGSGVSSPPSSPSPPPSSKVMVE